MSLRFAASVVALVSLCACAKDSTSPQSASDSQAAFAKGTSDQTSAQFTVYVGGQVAYRSSGPANNASSTFRSECRAGTSGSTGWYFVPSNRGSRETLDGPSHPHCRSVVASNNATVRFSGPLTLAKAAMELVFSGLCTPNASPCPTRNVHYHNASDMTVGQGVLYGVAVDDVSSASSNWTIDLSQIQSTSNLLTEPPRKLIVFAHNTDGVYADSPVTITW